MRLAADGDRCTHEPPRLKARARRGLIDSFVSSARLFFVSLPDQTPLAVTRATRFPPTSSKFERFRIPKSSRHFCARPVPKAVQLNRINTTSNLDFLS